MKKTIKIIIVLSITLIFFIANSCKKETTKKSDDTTKDSVNTLTANIITLPYNATSVSATYGLGKILIGSAQDFQNIYITIPDTIRVGLHLFADSLNTTAEYIPNINNPTIFHSVSGTIEILEYDTVNKNIKGTFNFIGKNNGTTIDVNNGNFKIFKIKQGNI